MCVDCCVIYDIRCLWSAVSYMTQDVCGLLCHIQDICVLQCCIQDTCGLVCRTRHMAPTGVMVVYSCMSDTGGLGGASGGCGGSAGVGVWGVSAGVWVWGGVVYM